MEAISTEVITTEKKRDKRGHRLYDEERKRRIVDGYEKSGLTQREYARKEGIRYSTLVWWLHRQRQVQALTKPAMRFAEVSAPALPGGCTLEVVLADGTLLRGNRVDELAGLVHLLRA